MKKLVEVIFVPIPAAGHLVSVVEFVKRLIHQDDRLSITIIYLKSFNSTDFLETYAKSIAASQPDHRVQVIEVLPLDPPSFDFQDSAKRYGHGYLKSYITPVRNAVQNVAESTKVVGLVVDFLCSFMVDIATEFDLPGYIFLTTNAAFLGLMLYIQTRHGQNSSEFETTDSEHLMIPGFLNHPVPNYVLPSALFHKSGYTAYVTVAERFKDANGILLNTFQDLESYVFNYNSLNGQSPPIYPVGPVIDINDRQTHPELDLAEHEKVMKWLDDQPQSSVIFLCFGSMGSYQVAQVKEIALGLEHSGFRFLWSLRMSPPPTDQNNDAKNVEEMLPKGFMQKIKAGEGIICGWAAQVEVLGHKAMGGFVSHCGWNSVIESLWFGVPIVTWPMYAEQQLNAYMLKELGLAVVLRLDYRSEITSELVMADEIRKAIGLVMDGSSELRKKVKEMAKMARKAVVEGGSSFNSIGNLIEDLIGNY